MKTDGHLGRCYLKGRAGDAANAILTAVGYNFRLVLAWLRALLCLILMVWRHALTVQPTIKWASQRPTKAGLANVDHAFS
jgi:transposase, IS5 family